MPCWRSDRQRRAVFAALRRRKEGNNPHTKGQRKNVRTVPSNAVTEDQFTRINVDTNGNPRYVIHFMNLLSSDEKRRFGGDVSAMYRYALEKARPLGGKKYHTRGYGGGIAFQSYNLRSTVRSINKQIGARRRPKKAKKDRSISWENFPV